MMRLNNYLESMKLAWAPSTASSVRARLNTLGDKIYLPPDALYSHLTAHYAPYTINTIWAVVVGYYDWCVEEGISQGNPYRVWKKRHARLFKHNYQRKWPALSMDQAKERIYQIEDPVVREAALQILLNGLRVSELNRRQGEGVIGKGGKIRLSLAQSVPVSYSQLYRALKDVGLKPHDLRKIAATHYREQGLTDEQMCQLFGWSNFNTARSYLTPLTQQELFKKVQAAR